MSEIFQQFLYTLLLLLIRLFTRSTFIVFYVLQFDYIKRQRLCQFSTLEIKFRPTLYGKEEQLPFPDLEISSLSILPFCIERCYPSYFKKSLTGKRSNRQRKTVEQRIKTYGYDCSLSRTQLFVLFSETRLSMKDLFLLICVRD